MTRPDEAAQRDLIRRAQHGNTDAFGRLVMQYQQAVYNITYRLTGNRQEAEDVAQEAFVKAYRALDRFDARRPFAPWLYRIATNTALNWIKRRRPESELDEELSAHGTTPKPSPPRQPIGYEPPSPTCRPITALLSSCATSRSYRIAR
jgi:RNA polymerase sigma-70 factor (ECF subfamily)